MRKLRERLSSKKGFTLVELIVVIVIILILATVLIPNVMRYIGQARESAFQSEASGYLTEISGYAAEHFAKYGTDLKNGASRPPTYEGMFAAKEKAPNSPDGSDAQYALTAFDKKLSRGVIVYTDGTNHQDFPTNKQYHAIRVTVNKGAVLKFSYYDGTYYVNWTQSGGWGPVGK